MPHCCHRNVSICIYVNHALVLWQDELTLELISLSVHFASVLRGKSCDQEISSLKL